MSTIGPPFPGGFWSPWGSEEHVPGPGSVEDPLNDPLNDSFSFDNFSPDPDAVPPFAIDTDPGCPPITCPPPDWAQDTTFNLTSPNHFESACPYRQGASLGKHKFRFMETFEDSRTYVGDSYGDGTYIDIETDKPCSTSCYCRRLQLSDFAFVVKKESGRLAIDFYDESLANTVLDVVGLDALDQSELFPITVTLDGLKVLAKYDQLKTQLDNLIDKPEPGCVPPLVASLHLLVDQFLTDSEIFKSFGIQKLYKSGFLTFEHWKAFKHRQLEDDITLLEGLAPNDTGDSQMDVFDPSDVGSCPAAAHRETARRDLDQINQTFWEMAAAGDEDALRREIDQGADVNQARNDGITALHNATVEGHESIVRLLLDRGVDINQACNQGFTALHGAAYYGHENIVRLLLDRGADINQATNQGLTALHDAALKGHESIVRLLLDRGVDINQACNQGVTALHNAAFEGHENIASLLLDRGVDVNQARNDGITALHDAALEGHENIASLLLDRGADINQACNQGITALHNAAFKGHENIASLLLDRGADVNSATDTGVTPLHAAASGRQESIIRLLLNRGAKVTDNFWCGWEGPRKELWCHILQFKRSRALGDDIFSDHRSQHAIRVTRMKFNVQHRAATSFMQSCPGLRLVRQQLATSSRAYQSGIDTLRDISRGRAPRDLGKVLAFLIFCRAASEVLDFYTVSEYSLKFGHDLRRWGTLFFEREQEFQLYKEAVRGIWGVEISAGPELKPDIDPAFENLLQYAQGLVSSLVGAVRDLFGLEGTRQLGLERSQWRWRQRQENPNLNASRAFPIDPDPPDDDSKDEPDPGGQEIIHDHCSSGSAWMDVKLVLLMTGAIFIILLIFLMWLRTRVLGNSGENVMGLVSRIRTTPDCSNLAQILLGSCQVLETYLGLNVKDESFHIRWFVNHAEPVAVRPEMSVSSRPTVSTVLSSQEDSESPGSNITTTNSSNDMSSPQSRGRLPVASSSASPAAPVPIDGREMFAPQTCIECNRRFSTRVNYLRHRREKHEKKKYNCRVCHRGFTRRDYLRAHACGRRQIVVL